MATPPLPPKRTKILTTLDNEWKRRLTGSFEGFNSSQVSRDHITKAEECIDYGGTRDQRYRLVPFERILNENKEQGKADYLTSMTSAYDLLLKFVINLLKPNRPPVWRSIKTNNTTFRARVACMKGCEDILKTAGYTEKKEDSLQFPESVQEPDKQKLYVIAAELLMARLEVDRMNPASQSHQQGGDGSSLRQQSPANQRKVQTAFVSSTSTGGSGMGGGSGSSIGVGSNQTLQGQNYGGIGGSIGSGQGQQQQQQLLQQQPGYHHQQHQAPQQYSSRTTVHPASGYGYGAGPGTSSQSVATQPAGYGIKQSAMQQQQQQQEMARQQQLQQDPQLYYQQEHQSALRQDLQSPPHHHHHHQQQQQQQQQQNLPRDTAREDQWAHGQEHLLVHRSQSDNTLESSQLKMNGSTRAVATENLGHPKRMPRVPRRNVGTPSPSSSTSSLSSLTPETEEPPTSAKQKLHYELPCIPEGGGDGHGEGDNADDFLKSLRERRMAAKVGEKKNVTADANINTEKMGGQSEANAYTPRPTSSKAYSRTTVQPESARLSQSSSAAMLSSMRQPLTPPPPLRAQEPLPQQTTPTPSPTPISGGQEEVEELSDSSSEKFSTPPTTAEQLATATAVSSSHTPQDTPTPSNDATSDPVLERMRQRRLELKQQRELSGKKSNASDSPPTTAETKTETMEKIETFPPPVGPTQLSTTANSSQHSVGGDESRQTTTTVDVNTSLFTGVYCPKCHCKVLQGQNFCSYCGKPVSMLFKDKRPPSANTTETSANGGMGNAPNAPGYNEAVDTSVSPFFGSKVPAAASIHPTEQSLLFDSSGRPVRASVPPEEDTTSKQPPPPLPSSSSSSSYHQQKLQAAARLQEQQRQQQQTPLRAQVDDNQPPSVLHWHSEKPGGSGSSQAVSSSSLASASTGASGFTPSPGAGAGLQQYSEKLARYREHLHKKGKSDAEINEDPEYLMMVEEERRKQQKQQQQQQSAPGGYGSALGSTATAGAPGYTNGPQGSAKVDPGYGGGQRSGAGATPPSGKKLPNMNKYDRIDLMASGNYSTENQRAMEKLKNDGQQLLDWIKRCVPFGYSLDEIQIASDFIRDGNLSTRARNPLQFLDSDWAKMTQQVQNWVANTQSERRPSVGKPSEEETRKALVEAKGQVRDAVDIIYKERKQKVDSLLKRLAYMKSVQPSVPELQWKDAVNVLSVNGMDVNKASYALQCEWLQPLYESINSEHKKLKQEEMAEIKAIVSKKDDTFSKEARCRMLMAECEFDEQSRAQMVLDLMEEVENAGSNYPLHYYVDAAHDFADLQSASEFLFKECPIGGFCAGDKVPIHEMITMPGCTHSLCKECFKGQFQVVIKEQGVKHFNCPMCQKPDMSNKDDIQEMYELLFVNMIKEHLGGEFYELCQEKLKEFSLTKDPNFLWCAHDKCGSGFIYEGDRTRPRDIQCPSCRNFMCWKCKKPWEAQHQGISCEQFAQWKRDNDPEAQELGLAAHLNDNGIECPACHARYELARGGCMHFKCTRCPNEFCSGCGESFKQGKECGKFNSCAAKGLHTHHPRDCLYHLRDLDVKELQDFLKENKMDFDTEPPKEQIEAEKRKKREGGEEGDDADEGIAGDEEAGEAAAVAGGAKRQKKEEEVDDADVELHCRVEQQKETVDGLKDEVCGRIVEKGHAGLCGVHYKEYLVNIINKQGLDPVTIYEVNKIKVMLIRDEVEVPEQEEDEDDQQYREKLIQHVQEKLNLTGGRKAGEAQQAQAAAAVPAAGQVAAAAQPAAILLEEEDDD